MAGLLRRLGRQGQMEIFRPIILEPPWNSHETPKGRLAMCPAIYDGYAKYDGCR